MSDHLNAEQPQPAIDYSVLSQYADKHRLHFNGLCVMVRQATAAPVPPVATVQGELAKFEAWAMTSDGNCSDLDMRKYSMGAHQRIDGLEFINALVQRDWEVWQARAAQSAPGASLSDCPTCWETPCVCGKNGDDDWIKKGAPGAGAVPDGFALVPTKEIEFLNKTILELQAPIAAQEPVYQVESFEVRSGFITWLSLWKDADKYTYDKTAENRRRIVYAAPPAPQAVPSELPPLPLLPKPEGVTFIEFNGPTIPIISDGQIFKYAVDYARAALAAARQAPQPELTVWYGSMPESNGKSNFTAILNRKDAEGLDKFDGFTIARSEYPERVRYDADCVRYLIGELPEKPWIMDYDGDKHSGYSPPVQDAKQPQQGVAVDASSIKNARADLPTEAVRVFLHSPEGKNAMEDGAAKVRADIAELDKHRAVSTDRLNVPMGVTATVPALDAQYKSLYEAALATIEIMKALNKLEAAPDARDGVLVEALMECEGIRKMGCEVRAGAAECCAAISQLRAMKSPAITQPSDDDPLETALTAYGTSHDEKATQPSAAPADRQHVERSTIDRRADPTGKYPEGIL